MAIILTAYCSRVRHDNLDAKESRLLIYVLSEKSCARAFVNTTFLTY